MLIDPGPAGDGPKNDPIAEEDFPPEEDMVLPDDDSSTTSEDTPAPE